MATTTDQAEKLEGERGKSKEPAIAVHHAATEQHAAGDAQHRTDGDDDDDEFQIMRGDGSGRESQRLQRRDLLALRGHQATERHVEQKCGNAEEDVRDRRRHDLLLRQLVGEEAMRGLVAARDRADGAVRLEQAIQLLDHLLRARAGRQLDHGIVERTLHGEGRLRRRAVHPQDGVVAVVRDHAGPA